MGTSGDRRGYKVFSMSTTVRNPKRNTDFLRFFKPYTGKKFSESLAYQYFFDLVRNGIYRLSDISESIKDKLNHDVPLTDEEAAVAIKSNPQATGLFGRVMTQLRSLKDQGFLFFEKVSRGIYKIHITALGNELVDSNIDATFTYTKAMIGMHANSPIRTTMLNKSRPFLNTLFAIREVKRKWKEMGNEAKGILQHEFSTFILSMKDCNYQIVVEEIIKYRQQFKYEINYSYLENYLKTNNILPLAKDSLLKDYPDEVFRKFEMTGLIIKRGSFNYIYYDFSEYNIEKIESILKEYDNYVFKDFSTQQEYYDYISNIVLPWQKDEVVRRKIVESKSKILKISIDNTLTLAEQENMLDIMFSHKTLDKVIHKYDYKLINKELLILAGTVKEKTKFGDISEPLRLEYLLAILIGKKYGTEGLVSNIIYSEDGSPLHFAPAKKCDIIFIHSDGAFIFEPTMQRGKTQILNNETTNVARHVSKETEATGIQYRAMMIAPYVHPDVVDYFKYTVSHKKVKIVPLNIVYTVKLIDSSNTVKELCNNFDQLVQDLVTLEEKVYADQINQYVVKLEIFS